MDKYKISVGESRAAVSWPVKQTGWAQLAARLGKCKRTHETVADYKAMTKTQRGKVKDIGGFVGGAVLDGGRRKADAILSRSLVTLDIDYGKPGTVETVRELLDGTAWCLYSTHSHTPEAPRYRLVLPLSREVTPEEYIPIARRVADDIGIDLFDSSTYEPSRLMYWPSCPTDGDFVFEEGKGDPLDADKTLASYTDWRNVVEWPVDSRTSRLVQGKPGAKQEDPVTKGGIIGAFCRCYSITEAIETFLPDVYTPTVHPDRWTYAQGSTEGGLVIYEDKWAYSHHGTDPCCEKLVNAFDLVRLHLYGSEDQDSDINTPVNRLPSFLSMEKMAREDRKVSASMSREIYRSAHEDFQEELDGWVDELDRDKKGNYLPSPVNFGRICRNDRRLKDAVAYDCFANRIVVKTDLPWRPRSLDPFWNNTDDYGLVEYVCKNYGGLTGKQTLIDASELVFSQRAFHPVRDYLNGLEWDGVERLDTMLCDYLGAIDNPLTRTMTRKHFVAAVARVMTPGCKYDQVLTLIGPEGCGKSTLISKMAGEWFTDSLYTIDNKEGMEQLRGKWLVEFGELTNYKNNTAEAYKAFLAKDNDSFRPAYGRKMETYPRQCVFFATTNENNFLKGITGNRRFWLVECMEDLPIKSPWEDLPGERDQLWAEAVHRWKQGEQFARLSDEMAREARERQEAHNEMESDDRIGIIESFIHRPVPGDWESRDAAARQAFFKMNAAPDDPIRRETICAVEVLVECFGERLDEKTRYRTRDINYILRRMGLRDLGRRYDPVYGRQRRYEIEPDPE